MKTMKQFMILVALLLFSSISFAQKSKSILTIEPIYGVETRLVRYPAPPRYVTGATYGARLLFGSNILAAEGEYTTAKSREDDPSADQKVEDTVERASLGIRSTLPMSKFFGIFLRAGARASQGESVITTNGVSETKPNPLTVDPYAGTGIQIAIHSNFALNAGATLIRNAEDEYDTQYTLGVSAKIGK